MYETCPLFKGGLHTLALFIDQPCYEVGMGGEMKQILACSLITRNGSKGLFVLLRRRILEIAAFINFILFDKLALALTFYWNSDTLVLPSIMCDGAYIREKLQ